jgi:hypothetical protein
MKKCQKCGTEMPENVKFCGLCGMAFVKTAAKQSTAVAVKKNISFAYKNAVRFASPMIKKPVFWMSAAAGLVIVLLIAITGIANSTGTAGNRSSGPRQPRLQTVSAPPVLKITCTLCRGTGLMVCLLCDGTGKSGIFGSNSEQLLNPSLTTDITLNNMLIRMSMMAQLTDRCWCYGGKQSCIGCGDIQTGTFTGEETNPQYTQYVNDLINAAEETGMRIFRVEGSHINYVGVEYCKNCEGAGFNNLVQGYDSVLCRQCHALGIFLSFPTSVNNAELYRSIGTFTRKEWSSAGTQKYIADTMQHHQASMDRQRQITDEYLEKERKIRASDPQFRARCSRNGCNVMLDPGVRSGFCFLHEGSITTHQFCIHCSSPRDGKSMWCVQHRPLHDR